MVGSLRDSMVDLRRLQNDALAATAAGDWATAVGHYTALETGKPGEGAWPLKLGECLRKLGQREAAVKAFTRALAAYTRERAYGKAVAVCKLVLEIEPRNQQFLRILARLDEQRHAEQEKTPTPAPSAPPPQYIRRASTAFSIPASLLKAERAERRRRAAEAPSEPAEAAEPIRPADAEAVPEPVVDAEVAVVGPAPERPLPRVVLPRTEFFAALDERQLRMVNERARLLPLAPGEILFAQGEPSDALYLVAAGRLAVLLPNEVARLERGDFFGEEVAVLPGRPRLCTLKAVEPCQVLWLGRDLVEDLVAETPALLAILEARLRERLLVMLAHSSPMLGSLPPAERLTLLRRFHFLEVGPGQAVEEAGASPGLFVLLAGMAAIAVDGETLAELEPGDTFGETALAGDVSGRLSATASERCFFLHLPGADLSGLPVRYPGMAAHLTAVAEQRLRQAEAFLATRAPPPSPAAASARLLLVHVDPVASRSYQEAFTAAGFQVDLASTAEPARRLIGGGRYDVVLCSVETLVHTGADLLGAVRRSDLDVPILLLARDARPDTAAMATRYGVVESFVEPLDAGRLLRTAVRAVHLHRLTRLRREARSLLDPSGEWMGDRAGLELHFGTALRGLWMAFQPIISVSARQVYAFEALLRSREAVLGSPVAVLRAAERLQRVHDVGRIARDCVAETARGAGATPTLFVNLHGQDLLDQHLLDPAARLSAIASQVVLELTERTPLDQLADLGDRLAALRALGYRFAISNLGAGHAALGSLAQLAPDVAKLDIALVRGIDEDSARQNLVAGMIGVCQDMNIPVVCGGVETAPERDTLMRLGADLMQGYLFARPGPPFPAVDPTAIGGSR